MPGILPMKMIKVGVNTQSRIAQACDRCRSKKIRCDGVRPCCTQCANVGFECKTSDKLSRRAFPRGYTESLEDRVRGLEAEIRDLKILLDEKDEKLDMLSRIHNFSSQRRKSLISSSTSEPVKREDCSPSSQEEAIMVELSAVVRSRASCHGTSTTAALIEAFKDKARDRDDTCPLISSVELLKSNHLPYKAATTNARDPAMVSPPRLLSDQFINIFFQEWQPLLPILHRPTFLRTYEEYLGDPEARSWDNDKQAISQLFLIFEIAAHSCSSKTRPATKAYEVQWRKALSSMSTTPSIPSIQGHLLAQVCYLLKAGHSHLLQHRACAISMIHQLALHQGHKNHSLPTFEVETRKRLFWCQYVLDKFASAVTGTPQLLREQDISLQYPAETDDENIGSHGVSPVLPDELTKMSSALALFRVARILAKSLDILYPPCSSFRLSLTKLHSLSDELDQWQEDLPDHLRLRFCNDKPATKLVGCRSPLLSLAYFYIRSLIHRPLLYHGSSNAESAATIILATAAKHELQILDLLDERSMNYTFPISKQDILLNAGFAILWQSVGLERDSKLIKDNRKSVTLLVSKLVRENQPVSKSFCDIAAHFLPSTNLALSPLTRCHEIHLPDTIMATNPQSNSRTKSTRKQLQAMASRLSSFTGKSRHEDGVRRASMSQSGVYPSLIGDNRANSTTSLSSTKSAPALPTPGTNLPDTSTHDQNTSIVNLDYFPFGDDFIDAISKAPASTMLPPQETSSYAQTCWDPTTKSLDSSIDMLDTISPSALTQPTLLPGTLDDWSSDLWHISPRDIEPRSKPSQSHSSFSEESLTSGDDQVFSAPGSHHGSTSTTDTTEKPLCVSCEPCEGTSMPIN